MTLNRVKCIKGRWCHSSLKYKENQVATCGLGVYHPESRVVLDTTLSALHFVTTTQHPLDLRLDPNPNGSKIEIITLFFLKDCITPFSQKKVSLLSTPEFRPLFFFSFFKSALYSLIIFHFASYELTQLSLEYPISSIDDIVKS